MECEDKVISSQINRPNEKIKNNLYDLIYIEPVKPLSENTYKIETCSFVPKCDKYYVPKKKNGVKVRTVRDIRNDYEREIFSYLPEYLENQKNVLMRKIRAGSSKEEPTRDIAKNILKNECPITRQIWQMVMNINPLDCKYNCQFVLLNGKHIQITGSKGGNRKFINSNDIVKVKKVSFKRKKPCIPQKSRLLHNALKVKFRPGPLTSKTYLDTSNQRYQFGDVKLVNLPKVSLDVQPSIGTSLTPSISTFIQNNYLFDTDEKISQKWADFSVSVVGKVKNGKPAQINEDCITFELNYKSQQNRLLVRRDSDKTNILYDAVSKPNEKRAIDESTILSEVKDVMEDILTSVEISLNQDIMYFAEDDPRDNSNEINMESTKQLKSSNPKIKPKRKCNELNRLDVTIITIPTASEPCEDYKCLNSFCKLGCVCESLKCSFSLKRHCGRLECMFNCKCDFSKYNPMDSIDNDCTDILPGLVNLDQKLGLRLAKEEQKFHQTVIVTDDKSIHLKSRKRNWKTSKKYAEFYSAMRLKAEIDGTRMLSIKCVNLDCKNIEPWCMVHNMYKCFCKGKFTEAVDLNTEEIKITNTESDKAPNKHPLTKIKNNDEVIEIKDVKMENDDLLKVRKYVTPKFYRNIPMICESDIIDILDDNTDTSSSCSRVNIYPGRKYDYDYYKYTNTKISEMEKDDKKIQKKLMALMCIDEETEILSDESDETVMSTSDNECSFTSFENVIPPNNLSKESDINELLSIVAESSVKESSVLTSDRSDGVSRPPGVRLLHQSKLVAWLEANYKIYKETSEENLAKLSLEAPKNGKIMLYSWEFILSRFREKKNYFLLSKLKPYRIFMAVNIRNAFFQNCINIKKLPLSDIENYPITVQNLLTNAINLKENFCILHGLPYCWELVGSVAKITQSTERQTENDNKDGFTSDLSVNQCLTLQNNSLITDSDPSTFNTDTDSNQSLITGEDYLQPQERNIELSKWFLMTIVNDFTEVRLYNKGFYVKYESLIKAINVARISGKTVRLSSQRCNAAQSDPQFGIYAIPTKEDYCVFIGPYEDNEKLGIETVKNTASRNIKECTRGIWVTTNKLDNINVIDNPLLYLPSALVGLDNMVTLENENLNENFNSSTPKYFENSTERKEHPTEDEVSVKKVVKPIRIKKGEFYHLSPNKLLINSTEQVPSQITKNLKTIVLNKSAIISPDKVVRNLSSTPPIVKTTVEFKLLSEKNKELNKPAESEPIAEIAPQIKENNDKVPETRKRKFEGGMYVLKPEEINMKSWENSQFFNQPETSVQTSESNDMDTDKFISESVVCTKNKVYIISDDEDDASCSLSETHKNIWIMCRNIDKLGWIPGRKDNKNKISFQFPGFKYTNYYSIRVAFEKINQVLSRKVYVPKHIKLEWCYVESEAQVKDKTKLSSNDLCSDFVMTKNGLYHKCHLIEKFRSLSSVQSVSNSSDESDSDDLRVDKTSNVLSDLEESNNMEEESNFRASDELQSGSNESELEEKY